jgi:hypothetical protein
MSSAEIDPGLLGEETSMTEISFLPDGRICVFGASIEIVDLLCRLNPGDESLRTRRDSVQTALDHLHPQEAAGKP